MSDWYLIFYDLSLIEVSMENVLHKLQKINLVKVVWKVPLSLHRLSRQKNQSISTFAICSPQITYLRLMEKLNWYQCAQYKLWFINYSSLIYCLNLAYFILVLGRLQSFRPVIAKKELFWRLILRATVRYDINPDIVDIGKL